jgi:short-subunit dehydrogenase
MLIGRAQAPLDETATAIEAASGKAWTHPADVSQSDQVQGAVDAAIAR